MYYRHRGQGDALPPGVTRVERNRTELRALASRDPPPGLLGYEGSTPVGWVSLGPRDDYAKLRTSPVMRPVDGQSVWSIVCFVVPTEHRRRGVAVALLRGAIEYARQHGVRTLEAYPVDLAQVPSSQSLWFGTMAMYEAAGFHEVARRKPGRPVVRLTWASA